MDELDLAPTAMAAGGDAIARDADGRVVFVEGALPGERVIARLVQSKKDFARAVAVDVLEASEDRVAPPCAARAAGCGACSWQHVDREAQGRLKLGIVADALRRIGRFDAGELPVLRTVPTPARSRRTTARLGVDAAGRAGARRRRGNDVVTADACAAAHPLLEELVVEGRFPGASEVVLRVGVASGERAVLAGPAATGVQVPPDVVSGPGAVVHEAVAGAWLQVSIGSFFQSGPVAAAALVAAVERAVGEHLRAGGRLVDAYGGVGLFGAAIGRSHDARVTLIENQVDAVRDARVNLAELDAVVLEGEVGDWRHRAGEPPPDVVVADPARTGLARPGVDAVVASATPRLVLVSCDPASLARDTRLLVDAGYRPTSLELVDAFPDTFHVEVVTGFTRSADVG